jgi:predicted transcriptional regulator
VSRHRRPQRQDDTKTMSNNSPFKNIDLNSIATLVNSIDINQVLSEMEKVSNQEVKGNENMDAAEVRKAEIINALTTLINADRNELIQIVLQFYAKNKNNNNRSNIR